MEARSGGQISQIDLQGLLFQQELTQAARP